MNQTNMPEGRGSGIFGEWFEDEWGLPAYRYEMRHDDPAAVWNPIIKPESNLHWHQLGNERITANAYNLGMIKVFCGETGQLWLNDYDPADNCFSGGFGWLISGDTTLIDRDDCIPKGAEWERIFGSGYFLKRIRSQGIVYERRIFAPAGDEPVLVSELRIKNETFSQKDFRLVEYWDVNISRITKFVLNRFLNRKTINNVRLELSSDGNMISAMPCQKRKALPNRTYYIDPELPGVFLACLDGKPSGWITDPAMLFRNCIPEQKPALQTPSEIAGEDGFDSHCNGFSLKKSPVLNQKKTCLAAVIHTGIEPGSENIFRFVYGYAKGREPEDIAASVIKSGGHLWKNTASFWKENAPSLKTIDDESSLGRELVWNNYYFNSSSQYDAYYQRHYIPQAGNYLYENGLNGASRDFFENILTLTYYRPMAAREQLEFMMRTQDNNGRFFYSIDGLGKRNRLFYCPSDLGLWFLWSLCEYIFATRDFGFLEASVPYYPLSKCECGSVWEHAGKAFSHLINKVGTGRNGHLKIRLSDWNDEMTWLTAADNPAEIIMTILRGESVLNTAMACFMLPMFAELSGLAGDDAIKKASADLLSRLRTALNNAWHKGHLIRSYSGLGKPFGTDETWLEPLVWALLARGSLPPDKESAAVETIRKKLVTESGIKISDSGTGSMTTRKGEQESGGIWFAINAPATLALSGFDKSLSWEVFKKNTLAWHAGLYPDKWYGIWSGPDAFNSPDSARPGESWYQKSPVFSLGAQAYPVQNIHSHSQMMYALARLAGISAGADSWTISPGIPYGNYSFSCSLFGVDVSAERISGYACLPVSSSLKLNIEVPGSIPGEKAFVDGQQVQAKRTGSTLELSLRMREGKRVVWDIF